MSHYQYTVQQVFTIYGRGIALVGFVAEYYKSFHFGDRIEVKRPDGSVVCAEIKGVEYPPSVKPLGKRPENTRYGVIVDLPIEEVPMGSEVWLCGIARCGVLCNQRVAPLTLPSPEGRGDSC